MSTKKDIADKFYDKYLKNKYASFSIVPCPVLFGIIEEMFIFIRVLAFSESYFVDETQKEIVM